MTVIRVRCPYCLKVAEQSAEPFTSPGADRQTHVDPAIEAAARAAAAPAPAPTPTPEPPKPENGIGVRGYRNGVSASAIHFVGAIEQRNSTIEEVATVLRRADAQRVAGVDRRRDREETGIRR